MAKRRPAKKRKVAKRKGAKRARATRRAPAARRKAARRKAARKARPRRAPQGKPSAWEEASKTVVLSFTEVLGDIEEALALDRLNEER